MPNSLKNSRVEDKNICIEPLAPIISTLNTADIPECKTSSNNKTVRISCPLESFSNNESEWNPIYER